jgi:DNA polymerase alpha subunit A
MEVRSDNNGFEPDVVSDHGNDMDVEPIPEVELKPDVEMQPKSEATQGSSTELADVSKNLEELKQEANGEVKIEKAHRLNAKIKAEGSMNRDVSSATAGWMKICGEGENAGGAGEAAADGNVDVDESSEFELKDGALPFYILDAYEEPFGINSGTVYLFGKVNITTKFALKYSANLPLEESYLVVTSVPSVLLFAEYHTE